MSRDRLEARLLHLSGLEPGWHEEGSLAPTPAAISKGRRIVRDCHDLLVGFSVFPVPDGSITFEPNPKIDFDFDISVSDEGEATLSAFREPLPWGVGENLTLEQEWPSLRARVSAARRLLPPSTDALEDVPDPLTGPCQALQAIGTLLRGDMTRLPEKVCEEIILAAPDLFMAGPVSPGVRMIVGPFSGPDDDGVLVWHDEPFLFLARCEGGPVSSCGSPKKASVCRISSSSRRPTLSRAGLSILVASF